MKTPPCNHKLFNITLSTSKLFSSSNNHYLRSPTNNKSGRHNNFNIIFNLSKWQYHPCSNSNRKILANNSHRYINKDNINNQYSPLNSTIQLKALRVTHKDKHCQCINKLSSSSNFNLQQNLMIYLC